MKIDPEELLTINDVCHMFDVGQMTIWTWRRELNLPEIEIPGNKRSNIRFEKPAVIKWAKENDKPIVNDILTIKEKRGVVRHAPPSTKTKRKRLTI